MANQQYLDLLKQGVQVWNKWRNEHLHSRVELDLSGANLGGANLEGANLSGADLYKANLYKANLTGADLSRAMLRYVEFSEADLHDAILREANLWYAIFFYADLRGADLRGADLRGAQLGAADLSKANLHSAGLSTANLDQTILREADLREADLTQANLRYADLTGADLSRADLAEAILVQTNLQKAILTNCRVYGVAVWDVDVTEADQSSLIITGPGEPIITVDSLKVAQFIYLLLNNREIREVIDTIGEKGVLILGRFSKERKPVLDALREKLRTLNFLPIVFDFERPTERDFTETVMTLAGLCRFIIADITNPSSAPLELQTTVPNYMIPFVPIIQQGEKPFAMFRDLQGKYSWVLDTLEYDTPANLIKGLERAVVDPALVKHKELMEKKVAKLPTRRIGDYL